MFITAIVDRFEKDEVVLLSDDLGLEINLPAETVTDLYKIGDMVYLTLEGGKTQLHKGNMGNAG